MRPYWHEIFGSAARAASLVRRLGAPVELRGYCDVETDDVLKSRAVLEGFRFKPSPIDRALSFHYHHGLETPRILGCRATRKPIRVRGDNVLQFGMLEGASIVQADRVVYDPQNPVRPTQFRENGSDAREVALVLNRGEAELLTGLSGSSAEQLADTLLARHAADLVVIKQGPQGALVSDGTSVHTVPAFTATRVWKIGSGDVFAAAYAYFWLCERRSSGESAELASKATAFYCETRGFPSLSKLATFRPRPVKLSSRYRDGYRPSVYLAGPFFTLAQLWLIEEARASLRNLGVRVFSPYHDVGHGSAEDVVALDLKAIESADVIFAVADGMDPGTVYEIGFGRAKGKAVVIYSESESPEKQKMMAGSACAIFDDFVTAIYATVWAAVAE